MKQFIAVDKVLDAALKDRGSEGVAPSSGEVLVEQVAGVDVGDKWSVICVVGLLGGEVRQRDRVRTTPEAVAAWFSSRSPMRVVLEVGTHSPWMDRVLRECGHEAIVVDSASIWGRRQRKSDPIDAERLARLGRDLERVRVVHHRSAEAQEALAILRSRGVLVGVRSSLIVHARGLVKATGARLPACSADSFASKVSELLPPGLEASLRGVIETVATLTETIRAYDRRIEALCRDRYPETELVRQIRGVGPVTSLTFCLTLDDPHRFAHSRQVGAYVGLVPGLQESGERSREMRITKEGDVFLRALLIQSAHYVMGPFGEDCDLRRHGERIAAGGGRVARRRAIVAVARKLAILMHRLWVSGEVYDPLHSTKLQERRARRQSQPAIATG